MTETTDEHPADELRTRILSAWERDPLFIDPIIAPGLTRQQKAAVEQGAERTIVLFTEADSGAKSRAYLVDDNGQVTPKQSGQLVRSKSDDFLPVELTVPYQLGVLVAAAKAPRRPRCRTSTRVTRETATRITSRRSGWATADTVRSHRPRSGHCSAPKGQMTCSRGRLRSWSPGMTRAGRATSASA